MSYGYRDSDYLNYAGRNRQGYRNVPPPSLSPHRANSLHSGGSNTYGSNQLSSSPSSLHHHHSDLGAIMRPYFHTEYGDTVLFRNWILRNEWDTVLTCIAFFLVAILVEGLKTYRDHLTSRLSMSRVEQVPMSSPTAGSRHRSASNVSADKESQSSGHLLATGSIKIRMFSWSHLALTLLHSMQFILSMALMLGVMTLNIWLLVAVVSGSAIGYFVFKPKVAIVHVAEQCH